jgi:hypothetical protein
MFSSNTTQVSDGGYQISRSLRFNRADSAYLTRTPASASNQKTWTWSGWVKRGKLNANQVFFNAGNNGFVVRLNETTDYLEVYNFSGGYQLQIITSQVFRDPSAWYHIVIALDTTQATDTNRIKLYVNGAQVTSFYGTSTYPSQNADLLVNGTNVHALGLLNTIGQYFDGYMTEVNFVNAQALTPSSFGQTNAQTGVWEPIAFSGTYGTNGFYLNFSDNSNTTAATLGKDYSGNGNNWTPNNFSVSAGAGNDSLVDSPTSYGTDTGVGGTVRGNYCTMNPLSNSGTLTNGNLDFVANASSTSKSIFATLGVSSGKWYWEMTVTTTGNSYYPGLGIETNTAASPDVQSGDTASGYMYLASGQKYNNGTLVSVAGGSFSNGDVIGVALDMDGGTIAVYKNNTSIGQLYSGITGTARPVVVGSGSTAGTMNFGQRPFAYTAPSGFKALCTQNLPTPTIGATTATQAGKYFNPVLYTGTGATNSITGVGFQPDWVWIKARSAAYSHRLADSVRGAGKELFSNESVAEATNSANGYVSSFNSDGFSLTSGVGVNGSGTTFVAWNWKANGAGSSNTSGSITSTASASTTSGFSVVTYTGTGANATVGHGLGVAPSFIIVKRRDDGSSWNCYHISLGASQYIQIDGTAGAATNTGVWNNTAPTSTVFSIGTAFAGVNASGSTHVAYCFAEVAGYSKFGSYTGNGSADGPFVYTGFRPAFFLVKKSDSGSESWVVVDNVRNTSNVMNNLLLPNTSGAEVAATYIDALSNGFKCRESFSSLNASGGTYIYMAFAQNPFKYSLAR